MSGGVDSSVAAYLLQKEGHEVIGLSFELWDKRDLQSSNVCCSVETVELARSVADKLGIDHHTADVRDAFYSHVIEEFCDSYIKGQTPNPCIACNRYIKFAYLLNKADELGADFVATGHYARIERDRRASNVERRTSNERYLLKKGVDLKKDQSYVLYVMKQQELARTLFPLGEMKKEKTREIAKDLGLATALRPESQEICFVGDERYADFIRKYSPEKLKPGKITDTAGKVLGEHRGIAYYTIGQRKGLGIQSLKPRYVVSIEGDTNTVVVGSRGEASKKSLIVSELNWLSIENLSELIEGHVKIRSTMKEVPAIIAPINSGKVHIEFDNPQWAPASGQSAVFYDGDIVIGGGVIE